MLKAISGDMERSRRPFGVDLLVASGVERLISYIGALYCWKGYLMQRFVLHVACHACRRFCRYHRGSLCTRRISFK